MNPKISICIPSYQQSECLRRTLDSILIQTFQDYEVIITDDTQGDSIKELLGTYNFKNKLKYVKNKDRKGSPENWNEAIRNAKGEYIKLLHHDDWFKDEHSLQEFIDMMGNNPTVDFGFCSTTSIYQGHEHEIILLSKKEIKKLKRDPNCLFNHKVVIGSPSVTIFKNNLGILFDNKLKWYVDIDFYIRFLNYNNKFLYIPKSLVCVEFGLPCQITRECENSREINLFEIFHLYKKIEKKNISDYKYIKFLTLNFLFKHRVRSESELIELGVDTSNSPLIKRAIYLNNILLKYRHQFKKIRNIFR